MTIPEASQLIMEAASVGEGGEIFVLDMGKPIRIAYLAEQMIRLSGKVLGDDIDIEYIGLRPGEKMYEELFHEDEDLAETKHNKLFLSKSREPVSDIVMALPKCLEKPCQDFDDEQLRAILNELVPEYSESISEKGSDTSVKEEP
jgi:FlaA1/EpsC-like NDP-sugar epimerase